jgi:phosphatidylserine decarboxylase
LTFKVAREGLPFILVPAGMALALLALGRRRGAAPFALASLAAAGFFRDPDRFPPPVDGAVLAPADGRLVSIERMLDPFVGDAIQLSIFLSPLDVHINRAPISGVVVAKQYIPGQFRPAYRRDAGQANERCVLHIQGETARVAVTQVAGVLARRIVCRVSPGDTLEAGQRFGMIRFGSRTSICVPRGTDVRVLEGQTLRGGETVIGVIR